MTHPISMDLPVGSLVALRYKITGVLGRGGMGIVYRAHHLLLEREVALKIVPPGMGDTSAMIRFEREARNAARLDHPGCCRVLDVGSTPDGHRFLAMELLEGPTLRAATAGRLPLPVPEALRIAGEMLEALDHGHRRGVVHRDIKPENMMMVGAPARVVIIDFGLSWALGDARVTRRGTTVGSPSYLSPERALGEDGDHRVDLYAVGVILYEMLAGRRPFAGSTAVQLAWMAAHGEAPPLLSVAPGVSPRLASVVHRALSKDPDSRFANAGEMRAALLACMPAPEPTPVPPPMRAPVRALVRVASPEDDESTALLIEPRSRFRDLVGRIRYGRWRWRMA